MWRILLFLLPIALAACQEKISVGPTINVEWDAVVADPAGGIIIYEVVSELMTGGEEHTLEVAATTASVSFSVAGLYHVGVRTVRVLEDVRSSSSIAWSDIVGYPKPWMVEYLPAPSRTKRIWIK